MKYIRRGEKRRDEREHEYARYLDTTPNGENRLP